MKIENFDEFINEGPNIDLSILKLAYNKAKKHILKFHENLTEDHVLELIIMFINNNYGIDLTHSKHIYKHVKSYVHARFVGKKTNENFLNKIFNKIPKIEYDAPKEIETPDYLSKITDRLENLLKRLNITYRTNKSHMLRKSEKADEIFIDSTVFKNEKFLRIKQLTYTCSVIIYECNDIKIKNLNLFLNDVCSKHCLEKFNYKTFMSYQFDFNNIYKLLLDLNKSNYEEFDDITKYNL